MKSIKKVSEDTSHLYTTKFELDYGMFQVKAEVYSRAVILEGLQDKVFDCDIRDIEFEFSMNGKRCMHSGFQELYEKLYGKGSYLKFLEKASDEVKEEFFASSDRKYLRNLSVEEATKYLKKLLTETSYATNKTAVDHEKVWASSIPEFKKEMLYTDRWSIMALAKIAVPNMIHKVKCKWTTAQATAEVEHNVLNLDKYFEQI